MCLCFPCECLWSAGNYSAVRPAYMYSVRVRRFTVYFMSSFAAIVLLATPVPGRSAALSYDDEGQICWPRHDLLRSIPDTKCGLSRIMSMISGMRLDATRSTIFGRVAHSSPTLV